MPVERRPFPDGVSLPISRHPIPARPLLAQISAKHPPTYKHMARVAPYTEAFATYLRLSRQEIRQISQAALLHDIGKLEIADEILTKPGRLDDAEMYTMCTHAELGARILARSAPLADLAELVRHHHEWFNGRGYPEGVAGAEIPWGSRLISICDAFDTMITPRPYASPLTWSGALAELKRGSGSQFDPELVSAFASFVQSGGLRQWHLSVLEHHGQIGRPEPLATRLSDEKADPSGT